MNRIVFRRLVASLLCAGLVLSGLEVAIADVHDGDATAEELASAGPASLECEANVPGQVPHDEPGHEAHVCHAGHAHVILLSSRAEPPVTTQPVHSVLVKEPDTLSGLTVSPDVPPPIA
jgi:hypothetical protein